MICGIENEAEGISIGIARMDGRKKLCLVVREGNCETKYASFNNDESAEKFMKIFQKFSNLEGVEQ